jgi:hypothetical protein
VFAGVAIGRVAVPCGVLLLMVESRGPPLPRVDDGARDALSPSMTARWSGR